jgi:hypothetical protein
VEEGGSKGDLTLTKTDYASLLTGRQFGYINYSKGPNKNFERQDIVAKVWRIFNSGPKVLKGWYCGDGVMCE